MQKGGEEESEIQEEEEQNEREGGGLETTFCSICYNEVPSDQFVRVGGCGHGFCRTCMITYIKTTIQERDALKCPFLQENGDLCGENIRDQIVSHLLINDKKSLTLYIKNKEETILRANPNCRWCPREGCGVGNIGEGRKGEIIEVITCRECGYEFCFHCGEDSHPTQTCEEFRSNAIKSGKIDKKAEKWKKKKKTKPCPQCKSAIEKDVGCNHMKCAKCRYEFCWLCMRKYTPDHYDADNWENGCPNQCFDFVEPLSERVKDGVKKGAIYTGAAIGSIFVIALAIPVIIIGSPFYIGYKVYKKKKGIKKELFRREGVPLDKLHPEKKKKKNNNNQKTKDQQ